MSIITEIKRMTSGDEFAALVMPNNFGSLDNISGVYFEIDKERFAKLRDFAGSVEDKKSVEVAAVEYFKTILLLDASVRDSEELMLLVTDSTMKPIPPIDGNVLSVLDDGTTVDWKLELTKSEGQVKVRIFGDDHDRRSFAGTLDTDAFPLNDFDPDSMRKDFFTL